MSGECSKLCLAREEKEEVDGLARSCSTTTAAAARVALGWGVKASLLPPFLMPLCACSDTPCRSTDRGAAASLEPAIVSYHDKKRERKGCSDNAFQRLISDCSFLLISACVACSSTNISRGQGCEKVPVENATGLYSCGGRLF